MASEKRCPACGEGILVDIAFTAGTRDEKQSADSKQVETYSCGHEVIGPPLDREDEAGGRFDAERRSSEDTVTPPRSSEPNGRLTRREKRGRPKRA
jgi:hypothetical protein